MRIKLKDKSSNLRRNGGGTAAASIAILLLLAASPSLKAQTNVECSSLGGNWCLRLSEKEVRLEFSTVPDMEGWMETDVGSNRNNYYRSMPTLELSNMGDIGGPDIVKFEMTIGDTRFHFEDTDLGAAAMLGMFTPGYDLTPTISADGNQLMVEIAKQGGGGLQPGESVHFEIDLGLDAGITGSPFYKFPDFRTVLFDKNGEQYYGPDPAFPPPAEDNAQVTVHFSNGEKSGPTPLPDFAVSGPQNNYVNEIAHPWLASDGVDLFAVSGAAGAIPEPGTAALALMGFLSSLLFGSRKRCRTTTS
jgi:hypothetical protein